jgi:hypothetical protein
MRRLLLVIAVFLFTTPLAAGSSYVSIAAAAIEFVDMEHIPTICNSSANPDVRACTLIGAKLTTTCNAAKGLYAMSAVVRLTPEVFTASRALLNHEFGHVADVAASMKKHVRALGRQQFETFEECEAAARVARDTFSITMQAARHATDERRDGKPAPKLAAAGSTRAVRAD